MALHATGATSLRVRLTPAGAGVRIAVADAVGAPVATVQSLVLRPVQVATATAGVADALFGLDWQPVTVTPTATAWTWHPDTAPTGDGHTTTAAPGDGVARRPPTARPSWWCCAPGAPTACTPR